MLDCNKVIKDLYTDAAIEIILPAGNTPIVALERGHIHGDSLSLLLFLIFTKPLMRWLHSSGMGNPLLCQQKQGTHSTGRHKCRQ